MRLKAHSVGFERDRSAAGEWVEDGRQLAVTVFQHLGPRFGVDLRRLVQFLAHHPAQYVEQALALGVLLLLRRPFVGMRLGIIDDRGKKDPAYP